MPANNTAPGDDLKTRILEFAAAADPFALSFTGTTDDVTRASHNAERHPPAFTSKL
jgi:hypothetical protein